MPISPGLALALFLVGVYFEQTTVVQAPGRPPGPGVQTRVYHAGPKMRLEAADAPSGSAFILRLDLDRAFRLDPSRKVAIEVDVRGLRARAHTDLSMARDLMGLAIARPTTTPLAKPHEIAGYTCQGYRITAGETVLDLYVTSAVPLGMETFASFLEWTGAQESLGPLLEAIRALPGFPLETRSRVMVLGQPQETRATVTKVRAGELPPSLFEVPAGYEVVPEEQPDPPKE